MNIRGILPAVIMACALFTGSGATALDILPPREELTAEHPRMLLRAGSTGVAISLEELRDAASHPEYEAMLARLRGTSSAACQAMVWLVTGDSAAADTAVAILDRYTYEQANDTFEVFFTLMDYGLAYDWMYSYGGFSDPDKAMVRYQLNKLAAQDGFRYRGDHIFHNYILMSACGTAVWGLASAGDHEDSDAVYDDVRAWFNNYLYPGMQYLDGLPTESLGYWSLYDFTGMVWPLLAAQSASGQDIVGRTENGQGGWLRRHFLNEIHSVQPDMRFLPWGDVIGGPNGSVTHEMAGVLDALTWALDSGEGAHFSSWLAGWRGTGRFYGLTGVFYMLYTTNITAQPEEPGLSYLAGGGTQGGHFLARSSWEDDATVVGFSVKDHYGDHNHYDQGQVTVYRNGLLATDPLVYGHVNGPQQPSDVHTTLIVNGQRQREPHGQDHGSLESFKANLDKGDMLDTGDFLFYTEEDGWAAAAGQYAQAYDPGLLESCVRQLLFIRPGWIVVADRLTAAEGMSLNDVDWLIQLAARPEVESTSAVVSNGASRLRCTPLLPADAAAPSVEPTTVETWRTRYSYGGASELTLFHLLEAGDSIPAGLPEHELAVSGDSLLLTIEGTEYILAGAPGFEVSAVPALPGDVNSDEAVDIFDLLGLLRVLGGTETDPDALARADVDGNGRADIFDLLELLRLLATG